MKKKSVIIVALVLVVAAAAGLFLYRHRGGDIIGVTSYADKNTVIVNSKTGSEFEAGTGYFTVKDGERIHMEYNLTAGEFDVYFNESESAGEAYQNMDVENLPTAEDMTGEGSFGQSGVSGKGSLDFDAETGSYTAYFINHGMVGKVTVTAK